MSPFFKTLSLPPLGTNCYVFRAGDACVVIDPGFPRAAIPAAVREMLPDCKTVRILLTHAHADHFLGADFVLDEFPGSSLLISEQDKPALFDPRVNCSVMLAPYTLQHADAVSTFSDGCILKFGDREIRVVATPGHTRGSVIFIIDAEKTVFSGDTLFAGNRGRTDLPGGDEAAELDSIKRKILTLPADYRVYPGHGPSTTVDAEKNSFPWLSWAGY
jgi:glyoxylase-like metal-dependent hydrolase (beta-lactamase superfamily II)